MTKTKGRALNIGEDQFIPAQDRKALLIKIKELENDIEDMRLHYNAKEVKLLDKLESLEEHAGQCHRNMNVAYSLVHDLFSGIYGILMMYIEAKNQMAQRESKEKEAIVYSEFLPTMWLANRIIDFYEAIFRQHDLLDRNITPKPEVVKNLFDIAKRKPRPDEALHTFLQENGLIAYADMVGPEVTYYPEEDKK